MKYEYVVIGLGCLSGRRVNCKDCMFRDMPKCKEKAAKYALEFIGLQQSKLNKLAEEHSELIIEKDELFDIAEEQLKEIGFLADEIRITRDYIHDNNLEWDLLSYCMRSKRGESNE